MGALFNNHCYSSQADAVDAYFTSASSPVASGQNTFVMMFEKLNGVWKSSGYEIDVNGLWTLRYQTTVSVPSFPECNTSEGLTDGLAVGWLVASAMIIAAAIWNLKKGAR